VSAFPCHAQGEPCPVAALLHGHFGSDLGEALLWNYTCFPMSDAHAYEQARSLVAADRLGLLGEYLASEDAAIEAAMQRAAAA
jgi:hypothetical protein